jgi:selenophosphate synthase
VAVERHLVCLDPQTSGGLLFAVSEAGHGLFASRLAESGIGATAIGRVENRPATGAAVRLE